MSATANSYLEGIPHDVDAQEGQGELIRRIVASRHFIRSPRLAALLEFLCEQSQRGNIARLTEYQIVHQVFVRKGRFDPNADTIVRSHMVRLRQKLVLYFQEEGAQETLRVSIPRGGYAPLFEHLAQLQQAVLPVAARYFPATTPGEALVDAAVEDTQTFTDRSPLPESGGAAPYGRGLWRLGLAVALVLLSWVVIALLRHRGSAPASPSEQQSPYARTSIRSLESVSFGLCCTGRIGPTRSRMDASFGNHRQDSENL